MDEHKPRKRPRQQRSRELVDAIVEAAARVFEREGLDATTNRIADEAGVSIGSLYQYFGNKHELLYALVERHLDDGEARLRAAAERAAGAEHFGDIVSAFVHTIVGAHTAHPHVHDIFNELAAAAHRSSEIIGRVGALQEWLAGELTAHVRRLRADLSHPERRGRLVATTLFEAVHSTVVGTSGDVAYVDELIAMYAAYLDS